MWELPFGKDRRWLNNGGVADLVLGGWQVSGILTLQDGFPFTVSAVRATFRTAAASVIPIRPRDVDWQLSRSERSRTRWFNTDAFVDRNPRERPFRYGTVARNSLIGPGFVSLDASANKRFMIGDQHLEFRVEVFNLPEPADLGPARHSAADAELRRDQQHADGFTADSVGSQVRVLSTGGVNSQLATPNSQSELLEHLGEVVRTCPDGCAFHPDASQKSFGSW